MWRKPKDTKDNLSEGGDRLSFFEIMEIEQEESHDNYPQNHDFISIDFDRLDPFAPNLQKQFSAQEHQEEYADTCRREIIFSESVTHKSAARLSLSSTADFAADNRSQQSVHRKNSINFESSAHSISNSRGCKCTKIGCLKLYCQCFSQGMICGTDCICEGCGNVESNGKGIQRARLQAKLRVPGCFRQLDNAVPPRVCNCLKSQCRKKYCCCFSGGEKCNSFCNCKDCLNRHGVKVQAFDGGSIKYKPRTQS